MGEHHLAGEAEADAGALRLGGEEGQEDVLPQALGHAGAIVLDLDLGAAGAGALEASDTCGALGMAARRFGGVAQQVDQHLAHQIGVGLERRQVRRSMREREVDAGGAVAGAEQGLELRGPRP